MDHRSAMLEIATSSDQSRLGVGAQLCWARAKRRSGGRAGVPYSLLISSTKVTVLRIPMMNSLAVIGQAF
jgi:hypothetical protein